MESLDFETCREIRMIVFARQGQLTSYANLIVTITDENDNVGFKTILRINYSPESWWYISLLLRHCPSKKNRNWSEENLTDFRLPGSCERTRSFALRSSPRSARCSRRSLLTTKTPALMESSGTASLAVSADFLECNMEGMGNIAIFRPFSNFLKLILCEIHGNLKIFHFQNLEDMMKNEWVLFSTLS